jgi:hypothetical protein
MYDEVTHGSFFLFFSILLMSSHISDHPQEEFSQIWLYMLERKVKKFKEFLLYFWRVVGTYCLNMKISEILSSKSDDFGAFFSQKS